mgnify:FL=1
MGYKMKSSVPKLLGINEKHSTPDIPVFEKNLGNTWGQADINRTVTVNSKLNEKQKADAVEHEKLHVMQMRQGKTWYDNNNVYHKPTLGSPILKYKRVGDKMLVGGKPMDVGDPKNPIEKEIYKQTGVYAKPIKRK